MTRSCIQRDRWPRRAAATAAWEFLIAPYRWRLFRSGREAKIRELCERETCFGKKRMLSDCHPSCSANAWEIL